MLALRLRQATAARHREVEDSALIRRLLRGQLDRHDYCRLLRNLHPIYATLEARLPETALPQAIRDPRLARRAALEADLESLHGPDWQRLPLTVAAHAYRAHLQTLDAVRLGAHAYVRYLGDLAGGQPLQVLQPVIDGKRPFRRRRAGRLPGNRIDIGRGQQQVGHNGGKAGQQHRKQRSQQLSHGNRGV